MIEAAFTLFPVPPELDVEPEDGADREAADALIRYLVKLAGRRFDGPMLERVRWVITRDAADLDGLNMHDCEDCAATLRVARDNLVVNPTHSLALGLLRLDEP